MERVTAIIIDDEQHCIDTLEWQLDKYCPEVDLVASCNSAEDGLQAIREKEPGCIFLDIEMPHMNGFDLLKKVDNSNLKVIFTTAYDEFAVKAFKVSAVDYLVKPIDKDELKHAVGKLADREPGSNSRQLELLLKAMEDRKTPSILILPTMDGHEFVEVGKIVRCESDSNYTSMFFEDGKSLVFSKTLKEIEEILPENTFFRVHHSHVVNLNFVKRYVKGDGGHLVMKGMDNTIGVSRNRKAAFLDRLSKL